MKAKVNEVGPAFFAHMGIPLMAGREFNASDSLAAERVAVVNQEFVNRFFKGVTRWGSSSARTATR